MNKMKSGIMGALLRLRIDAAQVALGAAAGCALMGAVEPSLARASLVEAMDLDALVEEADRVVLARVMAATSFYDDLGQIVTDVTMQVEETLKGDEAPGAAITVRRLGGEVGNVGMRVAGEPSFAVGETVLLFGSALDGSATLRPLGMAQGAVRVFEKEGRRWARSSAAGVAAVRRSAGGKLKSAPLAIPEPRKLDELLGEIRGMVANKKR